MPPWNRQPFKCANPACSEVVWLSPSRVKRVAAPTCSKSCNGVLQVSGAGTMARLEGVFDLMKVAEDEIQVVVLRLLDEGDEEGATRAWNAFSALAPSETMRTRAPAVYRHHVRELVERAGAGGDLRDGTRAEAMLAISEATVASRLDRDVELLALRIAQEIFPEADLLDAFGDREGYDGAVGEKLHEVRRRLRDEDRKLKDPLKPIHPKWLARARAA